MPFPIILPIIFNVVFIVAEFNVVKQLANNTLLMETELNKDELETDNTPSIVLLWFNNVVPLTLDCYIGFATPIPTFPFVFIVILSKSVTPETFCVESPALKCENIIELPVAAHILDQILIALKSMSLRVGSIKAKNFIIITININTWLEYWITTIF